MPFAHPYCNAVKDIYEQSSRSQPSQRYYTRKLDHARNAQSGATVYDVDAFRSTKWVVVVDDAVLVVHHLGRRKYVAGLYAFGIVWVGRFYYARRRMRDQ